jgi:Flp pilus assembly pilin Flp
LAKWLDLRQRCREHNSGVRLAFTLAPFPTSPHRTGAAVKRTRHSFRGDESGQGLVEYTVILTLVALALVTALSFMSGGVSNTFDHGSTPLEVQSSH